MTTPGERVEIQEDFCPKCEKNYYGYPSGYIKSPLGKEIYLDETIIKSDSYAEVYARNLKIGVKCDYCFGTGRIKRPVYLKMNFGGGDEP